MRLTRADRSVLSDWWFTVDRLMFFGLLLLMGAGLVLSLAASPPIAAKYDLEPFYFVRRHAALLLPAVAIMFAASTLTPKQIRRVSLVIFVVGIALMAAILFLGPEIVRVWRGETSFTIRHPWIVAFAFGLLHGFGFASGLTSMGLPPGEIPLALFLFNVGVELGQIAFVALILLLERSFHTLEIRWPRFAAALPGYVVGSLGAYWTIQRTLLLFS